MADPPQQAVPIPAAVSAVRLAGGTGIMSKEGDQKVRFVQLVPLEGYEAPSDEELRRLVAETLQQEAAA